MSYSTTILGTSGLVAYYQLDETSGTSAADSQGTNTGTYTGGFTLNVASTVSGTQITLNGTTGYVTIPTAAPLEITGNLTLEAWVTLTNVPRSSQLTKIVAKGNSANSSPFEDYALVAEADSSGHFQFWISIGSTLTTVTSTTIPVAGVRYHLVGVYDGSKIYIYVNGILEATTTISGTLRNDAQPLMIGAHNRGGNIAEFFPGSVDEVAIYNAALTQATIINHNLVGNGAVPSVAAAVGNFATAATWDQIDIPSYAPTGTTETTITTTYQSSSTFTPGAITIDGIGIKVVGTNQSSPTGTITVALDQAGSDVSGTVVTINSTDLDYQENVLKNHGWHLFKFAAPVTLSAATAYSVKIRSSVANQLSVYSVSGTNWLRLLRTTTALSVAPTTGSQLYVLGELTGTGTNNPITVTMDNTASTIFGEINIGKYGTLTFSTTASQTLLLRTYAAFTVGSGGSLIIGTVGTPISSTSTATIELLCPTNGSNGLECYYNSTFTTYGASKTIITALTANAAAAATTIVVGAVTNWIATDVLIIASTSQTATQYESRTISSLSGTTITIPALTNAHEGNSIYTAEVINLTQNVRIKGNTSSIHSYIRLHRSNVSLHYTEFYYLGTNLTDKSAIYLTNFSPTTVTIQYCTFHDCTQTCNAITFNQYSPTTTFTDVTIDTCGFYNIYQSPVDIRNICNNTVSITNNCIINTTSGVFFFGCINLVNAGNLICTGNLISSCNSFLGYGLNFNPASTDSPSVNSNKIHSHAGYGLHFGSLPTMPFTISNLTIYRIANGGVHFVANDNSTSINLTFDTYTGTVNNGAFNFDTMTKCIGRFVVKNSTLIADPVFSGNWPAIAISNGNVDRIILIDSTLQGQGSQFPINFITQRNVKVEAYNCTLNKYETPQTVNTVFKASKNNGVVGDVVYTFNFIASYTDHVIYNSSPTSQRSQQYFAQAPINSTIGSFRVAVKRGVTIYLNLKLRRSVSTDTANAFTFGGASSPANYGTNPNPNPVQAALAIRTNPTLGYYRDTPLASGSGSFSNASWELLKAIFTPNNDGVAEFCLMFPTGYNASNGWINIDDFKASSPANTHDLQTWQDGQPNVFVTGASSGSLTAPNQFVVTHRPTVY